MEVVKLAYPDHTQFDKNHKGYDASSSEDKPRCVAEHVKDLGSSTSVLK
jgi:predicted RNA-binding protein with PUA-like domain